LHDETQLLLFKNKAEAQEVQVDVVPEHVRQLLLQATQLTPSIM